MNKEKLMDIADRMERHAALLLKQARNLRSIIREAYLTDSATSDHDRSRSKILFGHNRTMH